MKRISGGVLKYSAVVGTHSEIFIIVLELVFALAGVRTRRADSEL